MADPVSIASVAFQATKIAWNIYQFFLDAQSAPSNVRHAHETITGLETTLEQIGDLLKRRPNPAPPEKKHHESIENIVAQCAKALQSLDQELPKFPSRQHGDELWNKWKLQVKTVLSETVVDNILKRIDQWNQMLQLGFSMLSVYSSWEIQESTEKTQILLRQLLEQQGEATSFTPVPLGDDFVSGIEEWKQSVRGVVTSVLDTESVRISPTILVEETCEKTSTWEVVIDDQESTTTVDSGIHLLTFDEPEPGRPSINRHPDITEAMANSAKRSAQECMKKGLPQKAIEYQKKFMAHRMKLSPPPTFGEKSDMEEALGVMHLSMGTPEGTAEATKMLHSLVEQEAGLPEAEQDLARKGRLYHRLSAILLDLGRPESMHIAALYAERAFDDRMSLEPQETELLKESAMLWYQALLKVPAPDEAEGLNDYTKAHLGFSVKPELATHHDVALEWCQNKGFDADRDDFRFDVCDSRVDSPLKGLTPLHVAVMEGDEEILKHMARCTTNLEIPERKDFATPLLLACTRKDSHIVKLCLENGAKVDARDQYDRSGLHRCQTARGGTGVATLLLESDSGGTLLDALDSNRETALYMASQMGNKPMVAFLLDKGASPNIPGPGGSTALMATVTAVMGKDKKRDIVLLLLQHGADPWRRDNSGNTAIDVANDSSIRELMRRHAVPIRRESNFSTHTSSSNGSERSRGTSSVGRTGTMSSQLSVFSDRSGGSSTATTLTTHPTKANSRSGSRWRFRR